MLKSWAEPQQEGSGNPNARDPWMAAAGRPDRIVLTALATLQHILDGPAVQVRCLECSAYRAAALSPRDIAAARSLLTSATR